MHILLLYNFSYTTALKNLLIISIVNMHILELLAISLSLYAFTGLQRGTQFAFQLSFPSNKVISD